MMPLIDIQNLHISFANKAEIVKGVSLSVEKGRTT